MDFLGRARKAIKGWSNQEPPRPQFFSVACPEGHALRGVRNDGYQALRCPTCGGGIFVLPRSPLPDPPAPGRLKPRAAPAPTAAASFDDDEPLVLRDPTPVEDAEEVIWLDEPAGAPGRGAAPADVEIPEEYRNPAPPAPAARSQPASGAGRRPSRPASPPPPAAAAVAAVASGRTAVEAAPEPGPAVAAPAGSILVPQRRLALGAWAGRHRVALLLLGVIGCVLSTVGYRFWVQRRENLPQFAADGLAQGEEAFQAGRFDEAKLKLRQSAEAYRELGIRDERSQKAVQLADESAILADLSRSTLEELIEEAAKFSPPDRWSERFNAIYRGQSLILDTALLSPNRGPQGGPELSYRIFTGRGPTPARQGRLDLTGFKLLQTLAPKSDQPLLFGARIEALTLENGEWLVRLAPDSGVVLTQLKALEQTGWDPLQSATTNGPPRVDAADRLRSRPTLLGALAIGVLGLQVGAPPVTRVEVNDLTRRADLVGKEVHVDGRVRMFQLHPGRGFDEVLLKETPVVFRLPPNLRRTDAPRERVAILQGKLKQEGESLVVDVTTMQLVADDAERLDKGLGVLARTDFKGRLAWSQWATRRARLYKDEALAARAVQVATEALRLEAEIPENATPEASLRLAARAREAGVPEPDPGALIHRAFVARSRSARGSVEVDRLADELAPLLPESARPQDASLAEWLASYQQDPYRTYLKAPAAARAALDRRLWADLVEHSLRLRAETNPREATALGREAEKRLPDRPTVAATLVERGMQAASQDVASLRRNEVLELARAYEKSGQVEVGRQKIRAWLNAQRDRNLARDDADGRLALAEEYQTLLADRGAAADLLKEAAQIDPNAQAVAEAFRRLGYRREGERWVDAGPGTAEPVAGAKDGTPGLDDPFENLSPDDVVARLGKPDRRSQVITQGRIVIQWVYEGTRGRTQVINFLREPNSPPRVLSRYTPK